MIEDWIDSVCDIWKFDVPGFRTVKSPYLVKEKNFPAAVNPATDFPIALTIPAMVKPKISKGSKHITWYGQTDIHVAPDLSKAHLPGLLLFPGRILRAAALHVQLSGTTADVGGFIIMDQMDGIAGPVALKWGDEAEHWGFTVKWMVEESLNGTQLPVNG